MRAGAGLDLSYDSNTLRDPLGYNICTVKVGEVYSDKSVIAKPVEILLASLMGLCNTMRSIGLMVVI